MLGHDLRELGGLVRVHGRAAEPLDPAHAPQPGAAQVHVAELGGGHVEGVQRAVLERDPRRGGPPEVELLDGAAD